VSVAAVAGLDAELCAAHAAGDGARLADLYARAAEVAPDAEAAAFYLTHAFVFALEAGAPRADALRAILAASGREAARPVEV